MTVNHLPELLDRCSEQYAPTSVDDFVGDQSNSKGNGARVTACFIKKVFDLHHGANRRPLKFLLSGYPGLGKSFLVKYLGHLAGCNKWNTTRLNGTRLKVEKLEEIQHQLAFSNLFGDWRMLWIDEADAIPTVAQISFLTLLDELPDGVIVACTSNLSLKNFDDRFQSRFEALTVNAPTTEEITTLLKRYLPDDPDVVNVAVGCGGNVRQALLDIKGLAQRSIQLAA